MRRALALALVKLAHKVYPPKVTEMPSDYVPVETARVIAAEERIAKARRDAYSFDSYREQLDKMRAARNPINRKGLGPLTELRYDE
ncbi:hypothetical protein SEA_BRUSACORAM_75 [Mycobacterium phage Brusacoram]|uniref:Uncharacterized protein n=7 Tax=Fishburnevirus TaxID=1983734 RepID=A0A0K1Y687_9CAUD|nr:hypothetical protein SEA_BRUSACORAM_75 [Mycobacterium phage Brusacoram]YP_009964408.1 hypothetical protein I5J40_gp75 [Mycobacterium phage Atcoo]YP_009964485.1 hypothetical protein I5J41_gp74 [Mycobacterium phage Jung]YP_009964881.1 hypothetical protein I5J46_gp79 [Mycobacterium phage FirstPlacePfu]ASR84930.1 hypothetical protein SEA_STEVIERAY_78 [Mycobacterium phage StevieRay]ATW59204.1 hypothetical protein SEA_THESPIS_75 [Mycobacterium phage Thespis]QPX61840.1 hypothetical protein SEA_CA